MRAVSFVFVFLALSGCASVLPPPIQTFDPGSCGEYPSARMRITVTSILYGPPQLIQLVPRDGFRPMLSCVMPKGDQFVPWEGAGKGPFNATIELNDYSEIRLHYPDGVRRIGANFSHLRDSVLEIVDGDAPNVTFDGRALDVDRSEFVEGRDPLQGFRHDSPSHTVGSDDPSVVFHVNSTWHEGLVIGYQVFGEDPYGGSTPPRFNVTVELVDEEGTLRWSETIDRYWQTKHLDADVPVGVWTVRVTSSTDADAPFAVQYTFSVQFGY